MRTLVIFVSMTLIHSLAIATKETSTNIKVIEDIKFKPHMIEHLIKGCPENSDCDEETGQISEKFKSIFKKSSLKEKEKFVAKYGLPFHFWTTRPKERLTITYQSKCNFHRPLKNNKGEVVIDRVPIYEGIKFLTKLDILKKDKNILTNIMMREDSKVSQIIPRNSIPFFTHGKTSYYRQEFRGIDYKLKITSDNVDLATRTYPNIEIQNTSCSKDLVEKFKTIAPKGLYQSVYCKLIYDTKQKKYYRYIFGWSC